MARDHAVALADDWHVEDEDWIREEDEQWTSGAIECGRIFRESQLLYSSLREFLSSYRLSSTSEAQTRFWEDLPSRFDQIKKAIRDSESILALRSDETGQLLCSKATWQRAVEFLASNAYWLWNSQGIVIQAPEITVGPEGSVDLHWESQRHELLVNIRADPSLPAAFYGDDKGSLKIKGTLSITAYNRGLLLWLANQSDVA